MNRREFVSACIAAVPTVRLLQKMCASRDYGDEPPPWIPESKGDEEVGYSVVEVEIAPWARDIGSSHPMILRPGLVLAQADDGRFADFDPAKKALAAAVLVDEVDMYNSRWTWNRRIKARAILQGVAKRISA
jgi:hypothetical protein